MLITVHTTWTQDPHGDPALFVWGEKPAGTAPPRRGRPPKATAAAPHPFAARCVELWKYWQAEDESPILQVVEAWTQTQIAVWLPTAAGRPIHSNASSPDAATIRMNPWLVEGMLLTPAQSLSLPVVLQELPAGCCAPDTRFWADAALFALSLLARQRYLPTFQPLDGGLAHAGWAPVLDDQADTTCLHKLQHRIPHSGMCACLGDDPPEPMQPAEPVKRYLEAAIDQAIRFHMSQMPVSPLPERQGPAAPWIDALLTGKHQFRVSKWQSQTLNSTRDAWAADLHADGSAAFRTCFRLCAPDEDSSSWQLDYLLQATDEPSLLVPASAIWENPGELAAFTHRRMNNPQERLLKDLGRAARLHHRIRESLSQPKPDHTDLSTPDAYQFLRETAVLLAESGLGVLVPDWWNGNQHRISARLKINSPATSGSSTTSERSAFGMDAVLTFQWQLAVGDTTLSPEEFERLVMWKQPLVQIRGQWVEFDPDQLARAIQRFDEHLSHGGITARDVLRARLGVDNLFGVEISSVESDGWMADVLAGLETDARMPTRPTPDGFQGALRPYQQRGYSWLAWMRTMGLGACLADDMGLGKTIQVIALLLETAAAPDHGPSLLICPTSVIGNWKREIERFAPSLSIQIHHGADRPAADMFADVAAAHDLVVTSYALAHRDLNTLRSVHWDNLILDEAQNIKNAGARQSQAVRQIHSRFRAALSGTPVENRLAELWSIMEFLNPGYLGSQEQFRRTWAVPIEQARNPEATHQLKSMVKPLVLRRLKTDPSIITDLPDKWEMKVFCPLVAEQATLYEAVVRDAMQQIASAEGITRKGVILATITKLKQVCNHPAHFLKDGSKLDGRSGKLTRLTEMLSEIVAAGDSALVFTQFAEMGGMLQAYVESTLGCRTLFLHGGVRAGVRDEMVRQFQSESGPQIFILSLKAGGVGLNLTRASHVFHFDRWWNPAVENQATDRAFRIGQQKSVQVHKFVCEGTIEETIDRELENKLQLADSVIGAGENWITELPTEQLREMLTLRRDEVIEEAEA